MWDVGKKQYQMYDLKKQSFCCWLPAVIMATKYHRYISTVKHKVRENVSYEIMNIFPPFVRKPARPNQMGAGFRIQLTERTLYINVRSKPFLPVKVVLKVPPIKCCWRNRKHNVLK